ncbi:hypothetical protein ACE1ET_02920 [Saccharicrinis sp. FJH62]|uniref:hypothetical protein n=1 Tax=Saccharicrinis sp. FJH62 TaxID=3344657 RepID=UPI0035D4641B
MNKFKRNFYKLVIAIPVIFAVVVNTTGYFPGGTLNPGTIRGFVFAIILFYFILRYYPKQKPNGVILGFTLYIGVLSLISSDTQTSIYAYLKFFIGNLMFPLGFYFINNYQKFIRLSYSFIISLGVFVVSIIISNFFKLGTSDYLNDTVYFGAGRVNITKNMLVLLFSGTILLAHLKDKQLKWYLLFFIIAIFFTLVGIKRSVLLSFVLGAFIYVIFNKKRFILMRYVLISAVMIIVFFIAFPKPLELFILRYQAREERIQLEEETIEGEARYSEVEEVWNNFIKSPVNVKLIGSEMFNDRYKYHHKRMLHTDYMVLLSGSGLIGLFLWFYILWEIIRVKEKYWKLLNKDERFIYFNPTFYAVIGAQLIMSISGSVQAIDLRAYIMLLLGAMIGTLRGEYLMQKEEGNETRIPMANGVKRYLINAVKSDR